MRQNWLQAYDFVTRRGALFLDGYARQTRGAQAGTSHWTGILTVKLKPPRDAESLRKNPLGLAIDAIDWNREFEAAGTPQSVSQTRDQMRQRGLEGAASEKNLRDPGSPAAMPSLPERNVP